MEGVLKADKGLIWMQSHTTDVRTCNSHKGCLSQLDFDSSRRTRAIISYNSFLGSQSFVQKACQVIKIVAIQPLSRVQLFAAPWTAAHQASLYFTISQNLFKLMFIESVMPSNHVIFCHPFLLLSSVFLSIMKL